MLLKANMVLFRYLSICTGRSSALQQIFPHTNAIIHMTSFLTCCRNGFPVILLLLWTFSSSSDMPSSDWHHLLPLPWFHTSAPQITRGISSHNTLLTFFSDKIQKKSVFSEKCCSEQRGCVLGLRAYARVVFWSVSAFAHKLAQGFKWDPSSHAVETDFRTFSFFFGPFLRPPICPLPTDIICCLSPDSTLLHPKQHVESHLTTHV